jgi:hypothetical protein
MKIILIEYQKQTILHGWSGLPRPTASYLHTKKIAPVKVGILEEVPTSPMTSSH